MSEDTKPRRKQTETLDPKDWAAFHADAHRMLDLALEKMMTAREGRVWTPFPDPLKSRHSKDLSGAGFGPEKTQSQIEALLPYGVGNTHPRFFGWVHGSGTPSNLIADIAASAMNANCGGRDHAAIYVERQVVAWCRDMFDFPETSSGLVVSGTSMATLIAVKAARDKVQAFSARQTGMSGTKLVGYTSSEAHSCIARTFDILGLGTDALRKVAVNDAFQMDTDALQTAIQADMDAGFQPFLIAATVGTVNVGSIDPLLEISKIATKHDLWMHIDGAFGACAILADGQKAKLDGIEAADSIAFDFHKWLHVNYDAGLALMRSEETHRRAFAANPDYLKRADEGLAAGDPWPVDYGPELSRSFRALKVWAQLAEHGPDKLGRLIDQNCDQAQYLAELVDAHPKLKRVAPVDLNICCFVYNGDEALNEKIVIRLQTDGIAAPSTTRINGQLAIRVNITNHRTQYSDLDLLVAEIIRIGDELSVV